MLVLPACHLPRSRSLLFVTVHIVCDGAYWSCATDLFPFAAAQPETKGLLIEDVHEVGALEEGHSTRILRPLFMAFSQARGRRERVLSF